MRGTKVIEAFGLSNVYYVLSLLRADEVAVDDWYQHPQMHPSEGNFLGDQTRRVVGLVDSHGDVWPPHLNLAI